MYILHLLHQYLPEHVGGTELYTQMLARQQVASGNQVAIFTPALTSSDWPQPTIEERVQVYRVGVGQRGPISNLLSGFRHPKISRAFNRVLASGRPDLVHIQHLKGLPSQLVQKLADERIPFVITLHDYWYVCANAQLLTNYDQTLCSGPGEWWLNCARCGLARIGMPNGVPFNVALAPFMALSNRPLSRVLDSARRIIAPTAFVRRVYSGLGVAEDKIHVIPHGIVIPETKLKRRDPKAGELNVSYVGGLSWQKGVHVLVAAANELPLEGVKLIIYGDSSAFPDYVARLRLLAHHPGIRFAGRLSRVELWSALATSDVVVIPSLWFETASLIVQEAFAMGVPVVASKIGALEERVTDGVDGILVPPGDVVALQETLAQLRQEPHLLARLRAGIRPVRTAAEHSRDIDDLYRMAINETTTTGLN